MTDQTQTAAASYARRPRKTTESSPATTSSSSPTPRLPDPMLGVWGEYKANPTSALRNQLMEHYLPLVKKAAERLHAKLPNSVQLDDLVSAGVLGLMDAIEAFQLDRHVRFSTFSAVRIRGAILDELRSLDWVPRLVRTNSKKLDAAQRELEVELGRAPSDEEVADKMQLPIASYRDVAEEARAVMVTSLSARRVGDNTDEDAPEAGPVADTKAADPVDESQRRALKQAVIKGLSRAERLLITLYYYENLTMREVGQVLDLSESRVSQMHTQVVKRLRVMAATDEDRNESFRELAA